MKIAGTFDAKTLLGRRSAGAKNPGFAAVLAVLPVKSVSSNQNMKYAIK